MANLSVIPVTNYAYSKCSLDGDLYLEWSTWPTGNCSTQHSLWSWTSLGAHVYDITCKITLSPKWLSLWCWQRTWCKYKDRIRKDSWKRCSSCSTVNYHQVSTFTWMICFFFRNFKLSLIYSCKYAHIAML